MPKQALAAFTGDNHLRPATWAKHPELYGDAYESWRQITVYASLNKLRLLLLGDLFDSERPDSHSVGQYLWGVSALEQARVPVEYIEGNHDKADPPWPSLAAWAHPVGKFMLGNIPAYGLSFTTAGDLPQRLAEIPPETRVLLCHQSWQEIQRVGHCDGAFSMIPHGLVMLTGDYHVCGTYTGKAANGEDVIAYSPGSTAMQALNEPASKYFGILFDDLSVEWVQLTTRPFISVTCTTEPELVELVERLRIGFVTDAPPTISETIRRPIVRVRYLDTIPEAYTRLTAVGAAYHLFLEPQRQITTQVVDTQAVQQTAFHSLMSAVAELCPPNSDTYNAARRLLESPDPKTELDLLFKEFKRNMQPKVIPQGFRSVDWVSVTQNAIVYRINYRLDPYRVVDVSSRVLCKLASTYEETVTDEKLLVKCGPPVVIMTHDGLFHGVYSDLEFDVHVVGLRSGDPVGLATRPKVLDQLPKLGMQLMFDTVGANGKMWPSLYKSWEITKATLPEGAPVMFDISNKLAASALAVDLMSAGKTFTVKGKTAGRPTEWTFRVSADVLLWIKQRCEDVLERYGTHLREATIDDDT